ncbi:MAG: M48 family metallopeptidase, partial [Cyclonatronaceae bacterium]
PAVRFVKRRRQKYIRIRVCAEEIIISAPNKTGEDEMKAFFQEKYAWVVEQYSRLKQRKEHVVAQNRFQKGYLYHEGEWKPVRLHHHTTPEKLSSRLNFDAGAGQFDVFITDTDAPAARVLRCTDPLVLTLVEKLYAAWAADIIRKRFTEQAARLKFRHGRVSIRAQKTRWGSCSSKGNINLNWRLIKCPCFVQDYIFVHEMCHLVHLNHSPEYWALVDSYFPRRHEAEAWLRDYGPVAFQRP